MDQSKSIFAYTSNWNNRGRITILKLQNSTLIVLSMIVQVANCLWNKKRKSKWKIRWNTDKQSKPDGTLKRCEKDPGDRDIRCVRLACQPTSQQYCSLILNQHQPPATSQSAVLFSHNKSALAISHSQANTTIAISADSFFFVDSESLVLIYYGSGFSLFNRIA